MFKLHDRTRRFLTLSLFLLLGPALLIVVLTMVYSRHSVRTVGEWEGVLTLALGRRVDIDGVSFPAPGVVRFSQMRVFDPETNAVVLQIPQWELFECFGEMPEHIDSDAIPLSDAQANNLSPKVVLSNGFYESGFLRTPIKRGLFASIGFACSRLFGKQPSYRHCEIPEMTCYDTAIPLAKDVLFEQMAKLPAVQANGKQLRSDVKPTVVFVGTIDIYYQDEKPGNTTVPMLETIGRSSRQSQKPSLDSVTIRDASFELRPTADQTTFLATFQQADQSSDAKPFLLAVSRKRGSAALTNVEFASGENEVPTRMLTGIDPFFGGFGPQSRFKGTITAESRTDKQHQRSRSLELSDAVFYNVALESLLGKSLTFKIGGMADKVALDSVKLRSESNDTNAWRLDFARGTMINARGVASWPGLRRLAQGTKLLLSPQNANPPDTDIKFSDGTFAFQIDPQGIRLSPEPVTQTQQAKPLMVIVNLCAVFWPNSQHIIRYDELLASLAQPNSRQIPLMPETQYLISRLPITVVPGGMADHEVTQRTRLTEMIRGSSEPQTPPTQEPFPPLVQQPPLTSQQLTHLQPPSTPQGSTFNASTIEAVPPLYPTIPQEPYRNQVPDVAMSIANRQPDPPTMAYRQPQDVSYTPQPQAPDSQFLWPQQSTANPTTPNSQPTQQPTQPLVTRSQVPTQTSPQSHYIPPSNTNLAAPQPNGVPYGSNSQELSGNSQLIVAQQPQRRVITTPITGMTSQVQTNPAAGNRGPFNSNAPTFELNSTQVATASQPTRYDVPPQSAPSSQPPSGQFGFWQTDSLQNNR